MGTDRPCLAIVTGVREDQDDAGRTLVDITTMRPGVLPSPVMRVPYFGDGEQLRHAIDAKDSEVRGGVYRPAALRR